MRALDLIKLQCYALENQCRFICRDLRAEDFAWRPSSGSPSIGWHLGHIVLAHDRNLFIGNQQVLPEDYKEFFGFKSSGDFPDSCDPNLLLDKLKEINEQILTALSTRDDAWLSENAADEKLPLCLCRYKQTVFSLFLGIFRLLFQSLHQDRDASMLMRL
ncbi:MAG: DinB family protein [Candidatus Heimdallarchaeota archaeon]